MAEKITELTEEQKAQIPVYRDMGMAAGLRTGPSNREVVMRAMVDVYSLIEKPFPSKVIFVKSPVEAQKVIHVLMNQDEKPLLAKHTPESNDQWVADLIVGVKPKEFQTTHSYGYGSSEAYWIFFYRYFSEVLGIKYDDKAAKYLSVFNDLTQSGWHYIFEECCVVCDLPNSIVMENNVISNESGPAIEFADGFKVWAIGGHLVNEQIVMAPESLTTEQIKKEENAETKRIMIERYGVSKYLFECGGSIIDMDALNMAGSSDRALLKDSDDNKWLIGTDGSTGRVYHMAVPEDVNTCREAHERISGLPESALIAEC